MSKFECVVYAVNIKEHPNADAIELVQIGDYLSIVKKGMFVQNDLVVYIPEGAVIPKHVLQRIGLWDDEKQVGKLAGKDGNRVKSIKLRGILSTGIIYPVEFRKDCVETNTGPERGVIKDVYCVTHEAGGAGILVTEGDDVTDFLGITKYEPVIPSSMNGEVFNAFGMTLKFDIENIKKFPNVFEDGEEVSITEKLHGTWCCFGHHPDNEFPIVTSKGLSDRGLAFKFNEENEKRNLYVRMFKKFESDEGFSNILELFLEANEYNGWDDWKVGGNNPFYILGEIFGAGVQDLTYGNLPTQFRVFDIYVGEPGHGIYVDAPRVCDIVNVMNSVSDDNGVELTYVPELYRGPFSKEILAEYTDGTETVSGTKAHIREGVVVRPVVERRHEEIGRVMLKSVSEKYILRKNATEYN